MYENFRVSAPAFWQRYLKQLMMLKLMLLMSLVFAFSANANHALAQRASLNVTQKSLKEVFRLLKEQTDVDFLFTESQLKNAHPVSISVKQKGLKEILALCFEGQGLSYVLNGNTVIVKKENNSPVLVNIQQRTITGIVTDEKGTSIPGVNIEVKGTGKRAVTNSDGKYSISIDKDNAVLVFSYMGMATQEVAVASRNVVNVELKAESADLSEVVVVGYGTQKKVNLTGAVASIDIAKVADSRPITNVSSLLTGLAPGLYVKSGNADPGGNASLLIRGQGTLNNSAPLVIIDGVEGDISRVSPQDISSVSVLKDASSAAIYGSRAANGVLLITTKQGVKGKFSISYDGYATMQSVGHLMPLVDNSVRYMELLNEAAKNSAVAPVFTEANIQKWRDNAGGDPLLWPNTNWADGLFRDVTAVNHNVSVSGGTDKLTSFMSFNYANNPGMIENTGFQRYSLRSNTQLQATSWLKVGMNLNGTYSTKDRGSQQLEGMFINSILAVPTVVPRHPDGRYGGTNNSEENSVALSPIFYVNQVKGTNKTNTLVSRFYVNVNPMEGLNVNASYNYNLFDNKITTIPTQNDRWNFQTNTILVPGAVALYVQKQDINNVRNFMDFDASYEKTLDKLNMKLMVGGSQERYLAENLAVTKQGLIDENLTQLNGATGVATATGTLDGDWAMHSYFARLNMAWDSKYLLELNIRRDGSSRFTQANRWGNFPSASIGWRISEEEFMKSLKSTWLNDLKFRASYGALGNNAVGDYESISVLSSVLYSFNNAPVNGFYQTRFPNLGLSWESTYVTNLGLDFSLFSNRLSGNLDAYNKLTKNILISLPAPLVNGTISIPPQNSAEVQNRGIELGLNWKDKIGEVGYFVGTNFTFNANKVLKFKGSEYSLSGTSMIKEGLPINTQYVLLVDRIIQTPEDVQWVADRIANAPFDPNDPETDPTKKRRLNAFPYGKPELGDFLFKDVNGDGIVDDNDRANVGKGSNPQFFYSFTLGANYKGFDFSAMIDGVGGIKTYFQNDYYNPVLRWSRIINQEIADGRWYPGRTTTATYPRLLLNDNRNTRSSDFWVQDMSFLKIRNIQLGYSLQSNVLSKLKASKIRFYATLENYFTFTKYKGLDPEVSGMAYPNVKQAVFGMNLTF